jgi:hypothetical protein
LLTNLLGVGMINTVLMLGFAIFLFIVGQANSAEYMIVECSIMGYQRLDALDSTLDRYVTDASVKLFIDEVGIPINFPPEANCNGSFGDSPCLKLCSTNFVPYINDANESCYRQYLFNECDSSVYHFGGDTYKYHQVLRSYLDQNFDSIKIYTYFNLYLNTLSVDDAYYILDSTAFVNNILSRCLYDDDDTLRYPNSKRDIDIKWISLNVKPMQIIKDDDYYYVKLYSWDQIYGKVEYWSFILNKEFMQIIRHSILNNDLGPSAY